jgi:hypothetical protein
MRAAGLLPAAATTAPSPAPTARDATSTHRGPGRPKGSRNKDKGSTGKGKGKGKSSAPASSRTRPLREQFVPKPGTEMSGPIPVAGGTSARSGQFDFSMPVPPLDVDELQNIFNHQALVSPVPLVRYF